jgi:hypothetical protein
MSATGCRQLPFIKKDHVKTTTRLGAFNIRSKGRHARFRLATRASLPGSFLLKFDSVTSNGETASGAPLDNQGFKGQGGHERPPSRFPTASQAVTGEANNAKIADFIGANCSSSTPTRYCTKTTTDRRRAITAPVSTQ